MKKLLVACIAAAALYGAPALAADMPVKAPPLPPAPVYGWTGSYVGVNIGYSWGRSSSDYSAVSANNGFVPETTSDSANINEVIGGGQVGYNYQFSQSYLAGIEADIQASGERGSGDPLVCTNPLACDFGNINDSYTEKLEWFGTVRGRLGYLATPNVLVYGTGGFAYGDLKRDDNYIYSSFLFCNSPPAVRGCLHTAKQFDQCDQTRLDCRRRHGNEIVGQMVRTDRVSLYGAGRPRHIDFHSDQRQSDADFSDNNLACIYRQHSPGWS